MFKNLRKTLRKIPLVYDAYLWIKKPASSHLLGMTYAAEQEYLERYGENLYTGEGEVVDLGSWLGSTTIPLVRGLLRNPAFSKSRRKVYAYDLFIWFDWMDASVADTKLSGKYAPGDNFVDEFKKRIARYANSIEVKEGDLKSIGWNGESIEFLLVDAMKSPSLAASIVKDFYPHLIEGNGLVFHQDFAHYFTPWIHLIQWKLRERFEFVEEIPASSSVVFKCLEKISSSDCEQDFSFGAFTDDDVDSAFEHSISLVSQAKLANIAAAKVMWYLHQNALDKATAVFDDFISQGVAIESDMLIVQQMLSELRTAIENKEKFSTLKYY